MSLQINKTDPKLGAIVENHLKKIGLHTPTIEKNLSIDENKKIQQIEKHITKIWEIIGMDLSDDSLIDTPKRISKMLIKETLWGLKPEYFPKCTTVINKMQVDEMICEKDITVMSQCEHHGVIIEGKATVAYIPNKNILGLSKINRIVEYFSKRPQIQERLTMQIMETIKYILKTDDVAVSINAKHYCVSSRGVEDTSSNTITNALSGLFKKSPSCRNEFILNTKT